MESKGLNDIRWVLTEQASTLSHATNTTALVNGCCLRNITKSCSVPKGTFLDANCFNSNSFEIWWKGVHPASQFLSIPIPTAGLGSFSPSCKLRAGFEITFGTGAVVRVDTFGPPWMDASLGCKKKTMWNSVHIYHTSSSFMDQMLSDMILTCHWSLIVFNVCISYINMIQYACTRIRFHLISMQYLGSHFYAPKIGYVNIIQTSNKVDVANHRSFPFGGFPKWGYPSQHHLF